MDMGDKDGGWDGGKGMGLEVASRLGMQCRCNVHYMEDGCRM